MKSLIRPFLIFNLISLSIMLPAQDLLVTTSDSLNCKVIEITAEKIIFRISRNNKPVETHVSIAQVKDFKFGYFDPDNDLTRNDNDTTAFYRIETVDGNLFVGRIVDRTREVITIRTSNLGDLPIKWTAIEKIRILGATESTDPTANWFDYLQSSRFFYSPSGYGLKQGDAYYQNVWILFNQLVVGITDHFSAGIGVVPLFLFAGTATPVWVTPKFSIPVVQNQFNLGGGALVGGILGEHVGFGVVYGIATVGNRDRNFSLGLGYGYTKTRNEYDNNGFNDRPTISFNGMLRVGKKTYLITENYLFDKVGLFSFGGRSLIRSVTLDYGLVMPTDVGDFVGIPWLGLVIPIETNLGKR